MSSLKYSRFPVLAMIVMVFGFVITCNAEEAIKVSLADKLQLLKQLKVGNFDALELQLATYQNAYENGRTSDSSVALAYSSFENSAPSLQPRLDAWVKAKPNSYSARMARGTYLVRLGWLSRGKRFAADTQGSQFEAMQRHFDAATEDLNAAISMHPKLTVAYWKLLSISQAGATVEQRNALLKKALEVDPASYAIREAYLFGLLPKWGGSVEAVRQFLDDTKRYVAKDPSLKLLAGFDHFALASDLVARGKYRDAIPHLNDALRVSENSLYYHERGVCHFRLGEYQQAVTDIDKAWNIGPPATITLTMRGWASIYAGDPERALSILDQALLLDEFDPSIRRARGMALLNLGRNDVALAEYTAALKYGHEDPSVLYDRGHLYLTHNKNYQKAEEDLKKAAWLNPRDQWILFDYGEALSYQNRCDAVPVFQAFLQMCDGRRSGCEDERLQRAHNVVRKLQSGSCRNLSGA